MVWNARAQTDLTKGESGHGQEEEEEEEEERALDWLINYTDLLLAHVGSEGGREVNHT